MKLFILYGTLLSCLVLVSAFPNTLDAHNDWTLFKNKYGKAYSGMEEELRKKIFHENIIRVEKHNALYEEGKETYRIKINKFSDMTDEEIHKKLSCFKKSHKVREGSLYEPPNKSLPAMIDWSSKGAVTPVKNQGGCGSCWAFSSTGALEGRHFLASGKLVSLSEQNLVDCVSNAHGCSGGDPRQAFDYVIRNKGIDTEDSYPYKGKDDECSFQKASVGVQITGYTDIPSGNETALLAAVATEGPISICIYVSYKFSQYDKGVFYEKGCLNSYEALNHCALVVGYGTDNGTDYWLVKNSWGKNWGEKGYIRMSRGKDNNCGIATEAKFPLVV